MSAEKIPNDYNTHERVIVLEQVIIGIHGSLTRMEKRMDDIQSEMKVHHRWTMGSILGLYAMMTTVFVALLVKLVH